MLDPCNLALARSHTYRLLSQLYLGGVTAELLPTLQTLPPLAKHLPTDLEIASSEHLSLFTFQLFPYESFFLDGSGLLGGLVTDRVWQSYRYSGYLPSSHDTNPDHLGHELDFLAFLCAAEAEAWEDGKTAVAHQLQQRQNHFLQTHLLRWLPPVLVAVDRHSFPFYQALAGLTAELITHHQQNLPPAQSDDGFRLPPRPLLGDEKTRLADITHYLLTPPDSGWFLSRAAIGQLAQQLKLPRGFGSRQDMLLNLFQTAAQYEAVPALLGGLMKLMTQWQRVYGQLAEQGLETAVWQQQLTQTAYWLQQMNQQLEELF